MHNDETGEVISVEPSDAFATEECLTARKSKGGEDGMNRVTFIPKNKDGTKGKALSMTSFFRCLRRSGRHRSRRWVAVTKREQ